MDLGSWIPKMKKILSLRADYVFESRPCHPDKTESVWAGVVDHTLWERFFLKCKRRLEKLRTTTNLLNILCSCEYWRRITAVLNIEWRQKTSWKSLLLRIVNRLTLCVYPMAIIVPLVSDLARLDNYNQSKWAIQVHQDFCRPTQ